MSCSWLWFRKGRCLTAVLTIDFMKSFLALKSNWLYLAAVIWIKFFNVVVSQFAVRKISNTVTFISRSCNRAIEVKYYHKANVQRWTTAENSLTHGGWLSSFANRFSISSMTSCMRCDTLRDWFTRRFGSLQAVEFAFSTISFRKRSFSIANLFLPRFSFFNWPIFLFLMFSFSWRNATCSEYWLWRSSSRCSNLAILLTLRLSRRVSFLILSSELLLLFLSIFLRPPFEFALWACVLALCPAISTLNVGNVEWQFRCSIGRFTVRQTRSNLASQWRQLNSYLFFYSCWR